MHGNDKQIEGNGWTWVKREGNLFGKVCVKGLQLCTYVYCFFFFKWVVGTWVFIVPSNIFLYVFKYYTINLKKATVVSEN